VISPGENHWALLRALLEEVGTGGNLTTDAHLAALAIERGAVLASCDGDFARYPRLRRVNPLHVTGGTKG
jgi:predicted nucleic acid-binding protein